MIVTTTPSIERRRIKEYLGVITGEAILGPGVMAGLRDVMGGRSDTYDREIRKARDAALAELRLAATQLRATDIVGVALHYETVGVERNMLMVSASGTAVALE